MKRVVFTFCSIFAMQAAAQGNIPMTGGEIVVLAMMEFHIGALLARSDLAPVSGHGSHFTYGVAIPLPASAHWAFRPRYDSVDFDTVTNYPLASATTSIKQHGFGVETIYYTMQPGRLNIRFNPYVGFGIGLVQTWYERKVNGALAWPSLPEPPHPFSESTYAPGFSLVVGCQIRPAMAIELRFMATQHHFRGSTFKDQTFAAAFHVWPAGLAFRL
jgi:hypothetical protein